VLESLTDYVSGSPWTYAFLFAVSALDVLIPIVPSETSVIAAGVLASSGDLHLLLVIVVAALGAIAGDNTAYWIGRTAGHRLVRRIFRTSGEERIQWAERTLEQRGGYLIVIGRFIPGGRTAITVGAGTVGYPWRRFIVFDVAAGILWASYAALLGYFGGKTFEESPLKGLALALGIALAVTLAVETVRWIRRRREPKSA
jgi:membrane-associated protein